jgi:hypothetical protein
MLHIVLGTTGQRCELPVSSSPLLLESNVSIRRNNDIRTWSMRNEISLNLMISLFPHFSWGVVLSGPGLGQLRLDTNKSFSFTKGLNLPQAPVRILVAFLSLGPLPGVFESGTPRTQGDSHALIRGFFFRSLKLPFISPDGEISCMRSGISTRISK